MKNERGIALLEFSYTAPLLALFIFSIVDLGRALNYYVHLTRLSYEAARYATSLPGLEPGTCSTSLNSIICPGRPLHALVAQRLIPLTADGPVRPDTVTVNSTLYNALNPYPNVGITGQDDVLQIEIVGSFEPLFQPFSFLTQMRARMVGPHARVGS